MAEAILYNVAAEIIKKLGAVTVREIKSLIGVGAELKKLKDTMLFIKAVVLDAEKKRTENNRIKVLLERLEEIVYNADDLVNEFRYEVSRRKAMSAGNNVTKELRIFFSSSNPLAVVLKMNPKIKKIREELNALKEDKEFGSFISINDPTIPPRPRDDTYSFVDKEEVIGREHEKKKLLEFLIGSEDVKDVSVISIVGIGGLGKTTLAQYVFNADEVQNLFSLKIWVCVSDIFNFRSVVESILKSVARHLGQGSELSSYIDSLKNHRMEDLQNEVREKLKNKKFLLVLDDVWTENADDWLGLRGLIRGGAPASKVIITTRSSRVADVTSTPGIQPYDLSHLEEEMAWTLFKKRAFRDGEEPAKGSRFEEIGLEILKKCKGVPLAIKTIGGLLYGREEHEWLCLMSTEFSKISQDEGSILPTLKLSYDHLPSALKHCFAICRLFPKDHHINVSWLIKLWMAEGFITSTNSKECLEDVGYRYFTTLLGMSFFQDPVVDKIVYSIKWGRITRCKMHDLMHDLAVQVAGCWSTTLSNENINSGEGDGRGRIRHAAFDSETDLSSVTDLLKENKLRTFCRTRTNYNRKGVSNLDVVISNLKFVRALGLHGFEMRRLPNNIGKLKHLTFLDLSFTTIEQLPDSITELYGLETLDLECCQVLLSLPRDMRKLFNLKYLNCYYCWNLTHMPRGIGSMVSLVNFNWFVLPKSGSLKHASGLDELSGLNNLRGEIEIRNLGYRKDIYLSHYRGANLKGKEFLDHICFRWIPGHPYDGEGPTVDEELLDYLQPNPNVKKLTFCTYMGSRWPRWVPLCRHLVSLTFASCSRVTYLPPMHDLTFLKELFISGMDMLEYVSEGFPSSEPSLFPSLVILELSNCKILKGWWAKPDDDQHCQSNWPSFPNCLSSFTIGDCPLLTSIPFLLNVEHVGLHSVTMKLLTESLNASASSSSSSSSHSSRLTHLCISCMDNVKSLPSVICDVRSLRVLDISSMSDLIWLPEEMSNLSSLETLHLYGLPKLESLPESLIQLPSLRTLFIGHCDILSRKYGKHKGEDWAKIEHIPRVNIFDW